MLRVRALAAVVALSAITATMGGCVSRQASAPTSTTPAAVPVTLSAQQIREVQSGLRQMLKDPDSARFSGPTVAAKSSNGDITACGMVNAKNSYGGYTGAGPYIAKLRGGKVIDGTTSSGRDADILIGMCRSDGVPI